MATSITFSLPVTPLPTPRPRCGCRAGHGMAYPDKKYEAWQAEAAAALKEVSRVEALPTDRPVSVVTKVYVERPRTSKLAFPKPDVDNYEKGVLDALTKSGQFWGDDSQVISSTTTKAWAAAGEAPGYIVSITYH